MIKWREHRPRDPHQQPHHIDLIEYLAMRLFRESMLIEEACRSMWGLDGTAQRFHHLHREHPYKFLVTRELHFLYLVFQISFV